MKIFLLLALVATVYAEQVHHLPGTIFEGVSSKIDNKDEFGNYGFGYKEDHTTGGTFRQETGDIYGNKYGSYGLTDADGRVRLVTYVADDLGFRAKVESNEPGVKSEDPADVTIDHAFTDVPNTPFVDPWKVAPKIGYGAEILKDAHIKPIGAINPLAYGIGAVKSAHVNPIVPNYFGLNPWSYGVNPWAKAITSNYYGVNPLAHGISSLKSAQVNPIIPNYFGLNPWSYGVNPWAKGITANYYGVNQLTHGISSLKSAHVNPIIPNYFGLNQWSYGVNPWAKSIAANHYGINPLTWGVKSINPIAKNIVNPYVLAGNKFI